MPLSLSLVSKIVTFLGAPPCRLLIVQSRPWPLLPTRKPRKVSFYLETYCPMQNRVLLLRRKRQWMLEARIPSENLRVDSRWVMDPAPNLHKLLDGKGHLFTVGVSAPSIARNTENEHTEYLWNARLPKLGPQALLTAWADKEWRVGSLK